MAEIGEEAVKISMNNPPHPPFPPPPFLIKNNAGKDYDHENVFVYLIDTNKEILMRLGVADPLVELLSSKNVEVQCNTCGCITALATTGKQKTTSNNKSYHK